MIFKKTLLYLIILIILIIGYFLQTGKKDILNEKKKAFLFNPEKVSSVDISFKNKENKKISLIHEGKFWKLKEHKKLVQADKIIIDNILNQLSNLPEQDNFKPAYKPSVYGLDPPNVSVTIKTQNKISTYLFGNLTPSGDRFYLSLKGSSIIFIVGKFILKYFVPDKFYYREKSLVFDQDKEKISYLSIKSDKFNFEFFKNEKGWFYNDMKLDEARINELIIKIFLFRAKKYYKPNPDNLERFGLNPPSLYISIGNTNKNSIKLEIGYNKINGSYILRKHGTEEILCLSNDPFITKAFNPNILYYKNRKVIKLSPDNISSIEFDMKDKKAVYSFDNLNKKVTPIIPVPGKKEKFYSDIVFKIISRLSMFQVEDFFLGNSNDPNIIKLENSPSAELKIIKKDGSILEFKILAISSNMKKQFLTKISELDNLVFVDWPFYNEIVKIWN